MSDTTCRFGVGRARPHDGPPCGTPAARLANVAGTWYCAKHIRFRQMRDEARRRGKTVPSHDDLESMIGSMVCHCGVTMHWLLDDGPATTQISLQHDRGGAMRFLCRSCNRRHASYEDDVFYSVQHGFKRCPTCREVKPLDTGYFLLTTGGSRRQAECRRCSSERNRAWTAANKEYIAEKQRADRPKRREWERAWRAANHDKLRAYLESTREHRNALRKERDARNPPPKRIRPDRAAYAKAWRERNKDKVQEYELRRQGKRNTTNDAGGTE